MLHGFEKIENMYQIQKRPITFSLGLLEPYNYAYSTRMTRPYKRKIHKWFLKSLLLKRKGNKSEVYDSLDYKYAYEEVFGKVHLNGNRNRNLILGLRIEKSDNFIWDRSIIFENSDKILKGPISQLISLVEPWECMLNDHMKWIFKREKQDFWYMVFIGMVITNRLRPPGRMILNGKTKFN